MSENNNLDMDMDLNDLNNFLRICDENNVLMKSLNVDNYKEILVKVRDNHKTIMNYIEKVKDTSFLMSIPLNEMYSHMSKQYDQLTEYYNKLNNN